MKRRHNREQSIAFCQALRARRPDMTFGADLIAGFPTETDGMFANSLQLIEDCGLTFLHIFPYSPRPNTPAAKMPQVPPSIRKDRARQLRSAGQAALAKHLASRVGQTTMVLWESNEHGHDPSFAPVRWNPLNDQAPPTAGQLSLVHLYAVENDKHLLATP
jgi:threonylcarbamoyladenosine tRNA methylthiotransferase MtaB